MAAPAYIEQLMTWVQGHIDDEAVLPSRIGEYHIWSESTPRMFLR